MSSSAAMTTIFSNMKRQINRRIFLLFLTVFVFESTAIADETQMSLAEGLGALTRLVSERDWNDLPLARPIPAEDQFKRDKETGRYRRGAWTIDLSRKTFVFMLLHRNGGMWERSGTFAQDEKLQWQAKVTQTRIADPPLPPPR